MTALFTLPRVVSTAGAKLYFYQTGTSTPQNTYQEEALSTPHANPVVADAAGLFEPIYLDPSLPSYRVLLTTSADVTVYQEDGIPSNQNTSTSQRISSTNPITIWHDTDGTTNQRKFYARAIGNMFDIGTLNDAESLFTSLLRIEGGVTQRLVLDSATTVDDGVTEVNVAYPISGSFTGTLTGMTGATTGTVYYKIVSNIVTLWTLLDITGTSNTTALTMTGLPAAVQPGSARTTLCQLTDNTQGTMAALAIISGSTITFRLARQDTVANLIQYTATGFTNSGTKGIDSTWMIQYVKTS